MAYITKRYSSCEFSDEWEDQGFKEVKGKGQKGRVEVHGVVNRKVFEAKTNNAQIKIVDDRAVAFTLVFGKKAVVLLGEHTISYRPEEMMKSPDEPAPTVIPQRT